MRGHTRRLSLFVSIGIVSIAIYLTSILGTNIPVLRGVHRRDLPAGHRRMDVGSPLGPKYIRPNARPLRSQEEPEKEKPNIDRGRFHPFCNKLNIAKGIRTIQSLARIADIGKSYGLCDREVLDILYQVQSDWYVLDWPIVDAEARDDRAHAKHDFFRMFTPLALERHGVFLCAAKRYGYDFKIDKFLRDNAAAGRSEEDIARRLEAACNNLLGKLLDRQKKDWESAIAASIKSITELGGDVDTLVADWLVAGTITERDLLVNPDSEFKGDGLCFGQWDPDELQALRKRQAVAKQKSIAQARRREDEFGW